MVCSCAAVFALAGCDKATFDRSDRSYEQAEQKRSAQEYRTAISFYEKALYNEKKAADAHFRMGMIYDGNLDDPIGAVYHFNRYIEMLPNGAHAKEARDNLKRIEPILATKLAGGTLISHSDAMKLRQENKDLRDQLAQKGASPGPGGTPVGGTNDGKIAAREAERHPAPGTRTYVVQQGDSLASISRKFYKTKARAKDIQDANMNAVPDERKLRPGVTLIIP